ncbi:hypothetical protein SSX86_010225 [Deinandra increscens subsp. villosa]|uniref:DUF1985 domain-containing protein n=1 Tax=Deinandra increscens subsp. villosa TaxID=3103831 RepID=A0AAP0D7M0_9ASTR
MVKTEEHDWRDEDTPKKKELYFDATVTIRCHIAVARDIQSKLRQGSARSELFRRTCFGSWLDVQSTSNDPLLVHLILQTQYRPVGSHNALYFHVGGQDLRFGPEEFCLITGMRFGPYHLGQGGAYITLRERVFGYVPKLKLSHVKHVFDYSLDQLSDLDAVRVCLLMLLEFGFMGRESKNFVDPALLQLVEDLDSWNTFPWGSYVWKVVYEQLHNKLEKCAARIPSIATMKQLSYSLQGFIWAFKIWIFEVFPYARNFAIKHGGIPRAISWGKSSRVTHELALQLVTNATMHGFEPLQVLAPTLAERETDWWRASHPYFDSFAYDSSPQTKKARLSSPPQSSVKVCNLLVDDIANSTTMPVEDIADATTSHRTTERRENVENKIEKPVVMTHLTNPEECVDELWKARQPHCVKTEMPMTSDLFGFSDRLEDHVVAGTVSSEGDIVCVQGYTVKQRVAPVLEAIFKKHGDIAAACVFKPASMRSSFLEIICEVVIRIQTNDNLEKTEEIEQQVLAMEAANIDVSWLRVHLEAICKRKEASKKCGLLLEMKANAILVKKAAQMDLRAQRNELAAAQKRVEQAERCVTVFRIVEKNLNDNILESKVNIDSWAREQVL